MRGRGPGSAGAPGAEFCPNPIPPPPLLLLILSHRDSPLLLPPSQKLCFLGGGCILGEGRAAETAPFWVLWQKGGPSFCMV